MSSIVKTERYQRGPFGTLIKWAFVGFNLIMLVWIVGGLQSASTIEVHSEAERAGRAIGSAIGVASLLTLWVFGDIILGVLVLFTRGHKVVTEEVVGRSISTWPAMPSGGGDFSNAGMLIDQLKSQLREPARVEEPIRRSASAAPSFGKRN